MGQGVKVEESQRNFPDFIETYLKWVGENEGSKKIHLWSCISILAGALERRCYLPRGFKRLYPNHYIFVVGRSGIIRKSSTTGTAVGLIRNLESIKFMGDRMTAGSFVQQFVKAKRKYFEGDEEIEQSPIYCYAPELIVLMKEVFGTLIELLTPIWDCPDVFENTTKHQGNDLIVNPCLNILAATTMDWLRQCVTPSNMSAGFAGRIIFVYEKEGPSKWVAHPKIHKDHEDVKKLLVQDLEKISQLSGEFKESQEAYDFFEKWYTDYNEEKKTNPDSRLSGYFSRVGDHLLKAAMVRSVSRSNSLIIEKEDMEWALEHLMELEKNLAEIYSKDHEVETMELRTRVLDVVRSTCIKKGYCFYDDVMSYFFKRKEGHKVFSIKEALRELSMMESIEKNETKDGKIVFTYRRDVNQVFD